MKWTNEPQKPLTAAEFMESVEQGYKHLREQAGQMLPVTIICSEEEFYMWQRWLRKEVPDESGEET